MADRQLSEEQSCREKRAGRGDLHAAVSWTDASPARVGGGVMRGKGRRREGKRERGGGERRGEGRKGIEL